MKQILETWLLGALSFGVIIAAWAAATYGGGVPAFFLPTPGAFLAALVHLFRTHGFLVDILISVWRVMAGFAIAAALGIPLGILIGLNKRAESLVEPLVAFIRYTPTPALIPLFILW